MSATKYPSNQYGLYYDESDDPITKEADLKFAATIASVDQALLISSDDSFFANVLGTWAFGALVLLLFGVCVDRAFQVTGMHQSSYSLAPAAIQSVTDLIGPILPFTGGIDLRRDDVNIWQLMLPDSVAESWEMRWHNFGTKSAAWETQDRLSKEIGRGGTQTMLSLSSRTARWTKEPKRDAVISATDSFLPLEKINQMTLDDLTNVFQYAVHVNRPGFDIVAFMKGKSPNILAIFSAMDDATAKSRGKTVMVAKTSEYPQADAGQTGSPLSTFGYGDIDALYFCAALKILAEWRMMRQVPEGFKGYEVGMSLGRKDVVQNLAKAENAIHHWIEERVEYLRQKSVNQAELTVEEDVTLRSPSLRELLVEEVDLDVHQPLPRLKEKSAAMGLLWVRRQLHYQVAILDNLSSGKHESTQDAVMAAYREVYSNYHGWAVQKIFSYSFQAAPPVVTILRLMHREYYEIILEQSKTVVTKTEQTEFTIDEISCFDNLKTHESFGENCSSLILVDETSSVQNNQNPFKNLLKLATTECAKIGNHVGGEWHKITSNVLRILKIAKDKNAKSKLSGSGSTKILEGEALEQFINQKMVDHNLGTLNVHFEVVKPLLRDLAGLFEELNMNDPTKV
jgi:hypothetical protein